MPPCLSPGPGLRKIVLRGALSVGNMTRAEACRVTRLNKGNFYAFLKGDTSKMSRKTAMNAYREIAAL